LEVHVGSHSIKNMNEFLKFFRGRWNSVVDSREKRKSIWSCRKKNYATLIVVFNLWAAWAAPKKHQKFNLIFFIILNISIYLQQKL
jgi:hypothetical protein